MAGYQEVAQRYADRVLGKTTKKNLSNPRMPVRGDSIDSYNGGWEIARIIRDKKSTPSHWFLNGERVSNTTSKHQGIVRGVLSRTGLPMVTIPHAALNAAGADLDTIQIIEVTADGWEEIKVTTHEFPEGAVWKDDKVIDVYERRGHLDKDGNTWVERKPVEGIPPTYRMPYGIQYKLLNAIERLDQQKRGYHYGVTIPEESHTERNLYVSSRGWARWTVSVDDAGRTTYARSYNRHWLGASLISAEVIYARSRKCAACKGSGKAAEPWQEPWQVRRFERFTEVFHRDREANEAERLERLAEFRANMVKRGETREEYIPSWLTTPAAPPEPPRWWTGCQECRGSGRISLAPGRRRAMFLSAFDENETRPSYFFCEMPPKCKATTVAEAFEALKPEAVKLAEQMGREVKRQGDIFAIPIDVTVTSHKKQGAVVAKKGRLFNTNHQATETAVLADGTTFVRGTLRHVPDGRRPDHKMLSVGKQWHLAVKNTVPVAR